MATTEDDLRDSRLDLRAALAPKTVSVVLVAGAASHFDALRQSLASLARQTIPAHEIILVVDGDSALLTTAPASFPGILVISNARGQGLAGARNTGILRASGAVVAFLDCGMVVEPGWLEAIATGLSAQSTMGIRITDRSMSGSIAVRRSALTMSGMFAEGQGDETANEAEFCARAIGMFPGATMRLVREAGAGRYSGDEARATQRSGAAAGVTAAFAPITVVEADVRKPLTAISAECPEGPVRYGSARVVVRDHQLRAILEVPLYGEDLSAAELEPLVGIYRRSVAAPTPLPPTSVRVVVATRDRTDFLARCLDSLLAQDHPNFEIVVVDNAPSSSATRELVLGQYAATGKVGYLLEERPGLANAHNRGLDGLTAEFVAFTDDDVVADRSWLSTLVRPFAESPDIGCITGAILPAELETRAQYWTELHGGFLKGARRKDFDLKVHRSNDPLFPYASGKLGSGANMAFRASALAAIGGFDPALGAGTIARGADDLAAFTDTVLAGYRLVYNPDALIWHYHRRGADGMGRQAFGYGVGLGAHLTRQLLKNPLLVFRFMLLAPVAAQKVFSRKFAKNARLPSDYPSEFVKSERLGILAGVPAYLKSRKAARAAVRRSGAAPAAPSWKST